VRGAGYPVPALPRRPDLLDAPSACAGAPGPGSRPGRRRVAGRQLPPGEEAPRGAEHGGHLHELSYVPHQLGTHVHLPEQRTALAGFMCPALLPAAGWVSPLAGSSAVTQHLRPSRQNVSRNLSARLGRAAGHRQLGQHWPRKPGGRYLPMAFCRNRDPGRWAQPSRGESAKRCQPSASPRRRRQGGYQPGSARRGTSSGAHSFTRRRSAPAAGRPASIPEQGRRHPEVALPPPVAAAAHAQSGSVTAPGARQRPAGQ
jgi:hypothetical protein